MTLKNYLVRRLQARLILVGPTPLPPKEKWEQWVNSHLPEDVITRKILKVKAMEDRVGNGKVLVFAADAADKERMQEVISTAEKQLGPINGVIHAAGNSARVCPEAQTAPPSDASRLQIHGPYSIQQRIPSARPGYTAGTRLFAQ